MTTKSKKLKSSKTKAMNQQQSVKNVVSSKNIEVNRTKSNGYISRDTYEFMIGIDEGELDDYKDFK